MKPIRVLPWLALTFLLLVGFGPFTTTIYRMWTGVSVSTGVINISVSPTALATYIVPFNPERYRYRAVPFATATAYACCVYGPNNSGTPAAVPTAAAFGGCAVGMYIPYNLASWDETIAPTLGLLCTTTTSSVNFSIEDNK